jgi:hypothetical protein
MFINFTNLSFILLGVVFGSALATVLGLYFFLTRSSRQRRNGFVFALGYFLVCGSSIGSLLLLFNICDRLGFGRSTSQHYAASRSYVVSVVIGVFFILRAEMKWRKSVGLWH